MANICTNILVLTNMDEALISKFIKKMKETFDCYYVDEGENEVEIGFSSKYSFPAKELKEITGNMDKFKACIDVLSYDFCVNYARYHQFMGGEWRDLWSGETI